VKPVLIVDDSLTVRMDLRDAFRAAGFETSVAPDLASARRALADRAYGLVVLDVVLPDGDGLELLAELKRSQGATAPAVVLLSSEAEVHHRVRGMQTGADEYVGKPYDAGQVVARARDLVRRSAGPRPAAAARGPVLVVDDSLTAREALRSDLSAAGMEVVTAATGEEGLRIAAARRPLAIVVDGVLPGIDGPAVVRQIRGDAVLRSTPCILLTGSGTVDELRALDAGADAYLRKEEGNDVVVARVQALLRGSTPPAAVVAAGLLSPKRVLAIAERPSALGGLPDAIRQDGHDVVTAASVEDARALLQVEPVDALLFDANASPARALDAVRALRAERAWRDVPILVFGGPDDHAALLEAVDAGADDLVPASSGLPVVRARLRAQLRRKQFEEENRSRDAYARSAAILETISDAFFAVDRGWRLVYVNGPLEALLEAPRDELLGATLWAAAGPLAAALEPGLRRAAESGAPATFEVEAPDGRWLEVRGFPHADGLSAHVRDVTERRRSQEFQAHLIAIVGHDLRTPLTAIAASSAMLLRDEGFPERHRRPLQRISSGASRMTRLINDLLDYSRARLGKGLPIARRASDLDAICRDALEDVRGAYAGRRIAYQRDGDGTGSWDPDRIEQVVANLLTNALRYSPPESEVLLAWRGDADEKALWVHNEGPPIAPPVLERIFEPFQRGDGAGSAWGGVGLGLYIVKQIVRTHGGTVTVRSAEGAGTTFEVRLPSRAPAEPRAGTAGLRS
jgi:PAS domain S-box-containing protein